MMKGLAIACVFALAACGSGRNLVMERALEDLTEDILGGDAADDAPARALGRAEIEAANRPAILARLVGDSSVTVLYQATANGPYDSYISELGQTLVLHGHLVTGTRGLGYDLLSVATSRNDPVVRPTPLSNWPQTVNRTYEFPAFSAQGRMETYRCIFELGDASEAVILGRRHTGIEVSETCSGPDGTFENLHLVDPGSGLIWRSLQWTGPDVALIDLQIVAR
ncbi:YjbF family lipoprotein [Amaricoccus macauensis]|uniref:YjbF family lipoprotein n=1 Tax=Amaricoccus macauensis TaxID=57001 RepID=UPI003C7C5947